MAFIEDLFEHNMAEIFNSMHPTYLEEMKEVEQDIQEEGEGKILTFNAWLLTNKEELGKRVYEKFHAYCDIEDSTSHLNYQQ